MEWLRLAPAEHAGCGGWLAIVNGTESLNRKKGLKKKDTAISFFVYLGVGAGNINTSLASPSLEAAATGQLRDADGQQVIALQGSKKGSHDQFALLVRQSVKNVHPANKLTHMGAMDRLVPAVGADEETGYPIVGEVDPLRTSPELSTPHYALTKLPSEDVWKVEDVLKTELTRSFRFGQTLKLQARMSAVSQSGKDGMPPQLTALQPDVVPILNNTASKKANLGIVQIVVAAPFTVELVFMDGACLRGSEGAASDGSHCQPTSSPLPMQSLLAAAEGLGLSGAGKAEQRSKLRALYDQEMCDKLGLCEQHGAAIEAVPSQPARTASTTIIEGDDAPTAAGSARIGESATISASNSTRPSTAQLHVARHALANLLGSLTYFHGSQLVGGPSSDPDSTRPFKSQPHGLLTGVPSRSFFPRGFLWDEGFHQLVVSQWDPNLARQVVSSWFATMDSNGWIAREQILGSESRSRVPEQFQVQRPDIANPPTMLFPILALAVDGLCRNSAHRNSSTDNAGAAIAVSADGSQLGASPASSAQLGASRAAVDSFCARHNDNNIDDGAPCKFACTEAAPSGAVTSEGAVGAEEALEFVRYTYPKLALFYQWFHMTQAGARPGSFRWRGATQDHNFASGLDDYPRGVIPSDADENVDLLAWMSMAANVLSDLALVAGDAEASVRFEAESSRYAEALDQHWDESAGTYCDIGVKQLVQPPKTGNPRKDAAAKPTIEMGLVCHVGYVSILPVLLRLVPADSPKLGRTLELMRSSSHLWSPYGLRSLSASDPAFGTKEDYWRQAVWINMNYLAVAALRHYGSVDGPYRSQASKLASELAPVVINAIVDGYKKTGFLWENYDSKDGHGRGTHPFTGWTALVSLMVAARYPV